MRHRYLVGIILPAVLFLLAAAAVASAKTPTPVEPAGAILLKGRYEVQFENSVNIRGMAKAFGGVRFGTPSLDMVLDRFQIEDAQQIFPWRHNGEVSSSGEDMSMFFELVFPENVDQDSLLNALKQNPNIRTVVPVYAMPVTAIPNDTYYGSQWSIGKIMAPCAWDKEKGSDTAKIAIIDTGVLYTHSDLADKIWVNPGEDIDSDGVVYDIDDLNGVDNDGNGVVDDLIGYDFFSGFTGLACWSGEDCNTPDTDPRDYNGHGTHCAGIAGAVTNNSLGVAGIAGGWGGGKGPYRGPRIICLRAGGSANDGGQEKGYINMANAASALDYAVTAGATVISCSWGSSGSPAMNAACNRIIDSGIVLTHAAGNDNNSTYDYLDTYVYKSQGVALSVASTDGDDKKSSFSNYGSWVDISAPGSSILNAYSYHYGATYATLDGTSMAAPAVAGLVALIKSHMPQYKKAQIEPLILNHADDIDSKNPGYEGMLGSGRINACSTLSVLPVAAFSAGPVLMGPAPLTVNFTDQSPVTPSSWSWTFGDGGTSFEQNPSHTYTTYGLFGPTLTVEVPLGTATEVLNRLVMVTADSIKIDSMALRTNKQAVVPIYLDNKYQVKNIVFPFIISGSSKVKLDSFSVVGTRTSYFASHDFVDYDDYHLKFTILLRSNLTTGSTYLKPGTGPFLYLYITDTATVASNELITIDTVTIGSNSLKLESIMANYVPVFKPGKVFFAKCKRGDSNCDGITNIKDVTAIIAFLYQGGVPVDPYGANVDALNGINIKDITYLINFLYREGPPPPQ